MDFANDDCFGGGPPLDQTGVLIILGALFLLFAWRAFRGPSLPPWRLTQRVR
ncbi:MAG TPA: hypothetical protein VFY65_05540 [Longimicrobium sp.]|nr:hypothetical protein [Longimicrobium sp.]